MNSELTVSPTALHVELKLPTLSEMNSILPIFEAIFTLVDCAPKITLSKAAKAKAVECRRVVKARKFKSLNEERVEAAQAKKDEKLRLEREEYEKLTPAQKMKRDEKEAKKKAKLAAVPRMKVKMM